MREITCYKTSDDRLFEAVETTEAWQAKLDSVEQAMSILPRAIDKGCEFVNGGGFIQHTAKAVKRFEEAFVEACRVHESATVHELAKKDPTGFVGRYLDDGGSPLYALWGRLTRIDGQFRKWGQAYYANNPEHATCKPWPNVK